MSVFPPDERPLNVDVSTLPMPCLIPGEIGFSPAVNHRRIGSGWISWSHGYTGDVYFTSGATTVTLTMPAGTLAVYFYVQPNPFAEHTFQVLVNGMHLSEEFTAHGSAGAVGFGVCANPVHTVVVTCMSGADFAIGEFGITCLDMLGACCDEATGTCTEQVWGSECTFSRFEANISCDELDPTCGTPGACCDDDSGECVDDVFQLQCTGSRFAGGFLCAAFDPPCGDLPVPPRSGVVQRYHHWCGQRLRPAYVAR
jgi:hypothetical protein